MFSRLLFIFIGVSLTFCATPDLSAQDKRNLELLVDPKLIVAGVPESFTFALLNISGHDLWLPTPDSPCKNLLHGYVFLDFRFTPKLAARPAAPPRSCIEDGPEIQGGILHEVDSWTPLHPGESLTISRNRWAYTTEESEGVYEFRAVYTPRALSATDQRTLTGAGIDYPKQTLKSPPLRFVRPPHPK
jgi:hypothetical protein